MSSDNIDRFFVMIGKLMLQDEWGISFSGPDENYTISCTPEKMMTPFYGHAFSAKELRDFIAFLQRNLKELENDRESNLE